MLHHHHDPLQRHMHSQYAQQGDANLSSSATNSPVLQQRRGSQDTSLSSSSRATTTPPQQTTTLPGSAIIELATPHNANVTFDDASENFTPMERDVPNVQSGVPGAGRPSGLMGHLRVTLHSARDLIHDDSERALRRAQRQDPYVIMSCGRESIKSRVEKEAGMDPVWDQTVLFTLSGREDVLHIRVWNQRFLADRAICRVDLPLTQIVQKRGPIAYQMVDDKDLTRNLGIITLTVAYIPLEGQQTRQPQQQQQQRVGTGATSHGVGSGAATGAALGTGAGLAAGSHLPRAMDKDRDGRPDILERDRNHDGIADRNQGLQPTMGERAKAALIPGRNAHEQAAIDYQGQGLATGSDVGYASQSSAIPRTLDRDGNGRVDAFERDRTHPVATGAALGTGSGLAAGSHHRHHHHAHDQTLPSHTTYARTGDAVPRSDVLPTAGAGAGAGTLGAGAGAGTLGAGAMDRNHDGIPDNQQGYADQGLQPTTGQKIKAAFAGRTAEEQAMIDAQRQQQQQGYSGTGSGYGQAGTLGAGAGAGAVGAGSMDRNRDGIPDNQQGYADQGMQPTMGQKIKAAFTGRSAEEQAMIDAQKPQGYGGEQQMMGRDGDPNISRPLAAGALAGAGAGYMAGSSSRDRNHDGIPDSQQGYAGTSSHLPRAVDRDQDGRLDAFERGHQTPYGTTSHGLEAATGTGTGTGAGMTSSNLPRALDRDRDGHMDAFERDRNHNGIPDRQEGLSHGIQTHPMSNTITGAGTGITLASTHPQQGYTSSNLPRSLDRDGDGRIDALEHNHHPITLGTGVAAGTGAGIGAGLHDRNRDGIDDRQQGYTSSNIPRTLDRDGNGRVDAFQRDRNHDGIDDRDQGLQPTMGQKIKAALLPGRTAEEQAMIDAQRQQQGYSSGTGSGYNQAGTLGAGAGAGAIGAGSMDRNRDGIPDNQQGYADQGMQPTMGQKIKAAFTGRSAEEQAMIDAQKQQGYGGEQQMMGRDGDPNISRPLAAGALAGAGAGYMAGSSRDRNHDGIPDSQQGYTGTTSHLPRALDRDQDGRLDAFERGHQTSYGTTSHGLGAGTGTGTGVATSSHLPYGTTSRGYDDAAYDRERAYGHIRDRSAILANVPIDSMDPMVRWTNTDSGTTTTSSHLPRVVDRDQDGRLDAFERGQQSSYGTSGAGLGAGTGAGLATSSHLPRALDRDRDVHIDAFERDRNNSGIPDRREGFSHGIQTHPMTTTGAGIGAGLATGSHLPRAMDKDRDGRPDILERDRNNDGIADRNQGMTSSHLPQFLDRDRDGRMDMFERDRGHGLDQGQYPTTHSIGTGTSQQPSTATYTMPIAQPIHSESHGNADDMFDMPPRSLPTMIQSHLPARASPITVPERVPYVSENPMTRSPQTAPAPNVIPARHGLNETQSLQDALRDGPQQQQYPSYQTQPPY